MSLPETVTGLQPAVRGSLRTPLAQPRLALPDICSPQVPMQFVFQCLEGEGVVFERVVNLAVCEGTAGEITALLNREEFATAVPREE